jgi:hypothetical protein
MHRRVERFARALDAPSLTFEGPVEIDEGYVSAAKKGHERDRSRARVACPRADGERTKTTSHSCSFWSTEAPNSGT